MADEGGITVHVADDDDDAAASARRIAEIDAKAAASRSEAARSRLETARLRTQTARNNVENALLTVESQAAAAEAQYAQAFEAGDFDTAAKATARISEASSRRVLLETQKQAIEHASISSGDAFEDHVSQFTDRTAQWMRQHREWVEDPRKNSKLMGAHHMAVSEGLEPDTPAYFDHVERAIGLRGGGGRSSTHMQRETPKYNPTDHRTHVTPDGVYLTENEKKIATDGTLVFNFGPNKGKAIGIHEMARRKSEMSKQGYYDRL